MGQVTLTRPEASQNMAKNPSAEFTFGFRPRNGATVTRSTTYAYTGRYSYHLVSSADAEGMILDLSALSNAIHYVVVLARGTFGGTWQWSLDDATWTAPTNLGSSYGWTIYGLSFPAVEANGSTSLIIRQSGAGASDYYVDAVMVEAKSYATTYIDGDQKGCSWDGAHGLPPADIVDGFTRADSASLGSTDTGQAWTETTWGISANRAYNNPAEGAEQLTNPGFEGAYVAGVAPDWGMEVANGTESEEVVDVHGGASAQKLDATGNLREYILSNEITPGSAVWAKVTMWTKCLATGTISLGVRRGGTGADWPGGALAIGGSIQGAYAQKSITGRLSPAGNWGVKVDALSGVVLLDDATFTILTTADLFAKLASYSVDGVAECEPSIAAYRQAGMVLRYQDDSNFLLAYIDRLDGNCYFVQCVAGVYTNIFAAAAVSYVANKLLRVELDGTTGTVYYGGVLVGSGTVPASTYKVHGLFTTAQGNSTVFYAFRWLHGQHGSSSTRSAQSRAGGRVIDIEDTYDVIVERKTSYGVPPLRHNVTEQSLLPGSLLQSVKVLPRVLQFDVLAASSTAAGIHSLRKSLIDLTKPHLVSPLQPVRLRYAGAGETVEIAGYYDVGLAGAALEANSEVLPLRFICYDPFWRAICDSALDLTTKQSVSDADYVVKRVAGAWSNISTQFNGAVYAIAIGPDGCAYIGGAFTNVGDANGDYIVKYDPVADSLSSLGSGMDGLVYTLAFDAGGNLWAGGDFNAAGGVANTAKLAKWDGASWISPSATQPNQAVRYMAFAPNGDLYLGGLFTNLGDANGDFISRYDGSAYNSLGSGMNGTVYAFAFDTSGNVYVGGSFLSAGGVANTNRIAKWNGLAWSSITATVADAAVYALAMGADGVLYAGGTFTTIGGVSCARIAAYNGSKWTPLGSGMNGTVYSLLIIGNLLWAGGAFTTAGGLTLADHLATWNGSAWLHPDVNLPGVSDVYYMAYRDVGESLYLGYSTAGTATTSAQTTVTNDGSSDAYPQLVIKRSGGTSATLQWLRNETTGKTVWFNYSLLDGEELAIDFTPGNKSVTSSYFGNVLRAILRGSDFASWCLQAGDNVVSLFISDAGTPNLEAYLLWQDTHLSVDGVAS